jgi:adenosylmethionine-8-amino-7-oxononanoate aminotransferase
MPGFLKVFPPTHYRSQFSSWDECNRFAAHAFEDMILGEDPNTVAGIIVEPIGNTGGIITPTPEYFQIIRGICDRYNVSLIFDEIVTGFGKTGRMFAAQTFDVTPDLLCCGKGISNGAIPFSAMVAREDYADAFWGKAKDDVQFMHGQTFAGNPLACAAGIAVIDEIVERKLEQNALEVGEYLATKLESLKKYGVVREVRGRGILRGVELVKDTKTLQPFPELGIALKQTSLDNGLILRVDPTWFAVSPALIATKAEIDELFELLERSFVQALDRVASVASVA